jgi:hypothetical protein
MKGKSDVPIKWRDRQPIVEEYAFSTTEGALNLAPPIIIRNLTLGTFLSATPYTIYINDHFSLISI